MPSESKLRSALATVRAIEEFLALASLDNCVFLLGAGASAPLVPVLSELLKHLKADIEQHVSFGPAFGRSSELVDTLASPVEKADGLLQSCGAPTLETLIQLNLRPRLSAPGPPPQYEFFDLTPNKAVIATLNNDGLAPRYCGGREVIELHGRVDERFCEAVLRIGLEEVLYWTQEGIELAPRCVWYPLPEPDWIANTETMGRFRECLLTAGSVIVIGYSFGMSPGGSFNDRVTNRLFWETLRHRPEVPVAVVNPSGYELVGALREDLKRRHLPWIPYQWDRLAAAVLEIAAMDGRSLPYTYVPHAASILRQIAR